jgi:hypothetical protein
MKQLYEPAFKAPCERQQASCVMLMNKFICGDFIIMIIFVQIQGVISIKRSGVFENRVLGRIFGPKKEEVVGNWRRLHNEELHNLYT